jgi:hypothetical protein
MKNELCLFKQMAVITQRSKRINITVIGYRLCIGFYSECMLTDILQFDLGCALKGL